MIIILLKGSVPADWRNFKSSAGLSENMSGISLLLLLFLTEFSQQCQNSAQHGSGGTERLEVNGGCGRRPQDEHPTRGLQAGEKREAFTQKVLLCFRVQVLGNGISFC